MSHLLVSNEDPVDLDGYIDGSNALQIKHDSDNLVDYDQEIWCEHDSSSSITVRIHDFVVGATTWQVSAEHNRTSWTRESDHVWFTFTQEPSSAHVVEVGASAPGHSPKQRTLLVKPQPTQPSLLLQPPAEQTL
ncbi:MAG TPA: hypothetical protein VK034_26210 [Enhygromyxa sp.]|nr:hypothetical protein [Enhygromyxa sp.]